MNKNSDKLIGIANFDKIKNNQRFKNKKPNLILITIILSSISIAFFSAKLNFSKVNKELKNTIFFAVDIDNKNIVALNDSEISLANISKYDNYEMSYYNGKLYLYLYDFETNTSTINYIDLSRGNGKYEIKKLCDLDKIVYKMAVLDDYIYYYIDSSDYLYRYSKKEDKFEKTNILSTPSFTSIPDKNLLFYVENDILYELNLNTNKIKQIDNSAGSKLIKFSFDNKLIYEKEQDNIDNYYEYDSFNKKITKIFQTKETVIEDFKIVPYKGGYIFVDYDHSIKIMDKNKRIKNFYNFELDPYKLVLLPGENIEISFVSETQNDSDVIITLTTKMNLESKKFLKSNNKNKYDSVVYFK